MLVRSAFPNVFLMRRKEVCFLVKHSHILSSNVVEEKPGTVSSESLVSFKIEISAVLDAIKKKTRNITNAELRDVLFRCASYLLITKVIKYRLLYNAIAQLTFII